VPMSRPPFHATFPGPVAGSGPIAILLRLLLVGLGLAIAMFMIVLAFFVGGVLLLLRAMGLGGKPAHQAPVAPPTEPTVTQPPSAEVVPQDTVKQLEDFHGSLDEFLEQRKGQNHS